MRLNEIWNHSSSKHSPFGYSYFNSGVSEADPHGKRIWAMQEDTSQDRLNSNTAVKSYYYSMKGHAENCTKNYCELSNCSARQSPVVSTPGIDDYLIFADKFETKDVPSALCSRIVLRILFFAMIARPGLVASVYILAREVTRWTAAYDDA